MLEASPSRSLPEASRRAAVEAVVQSGSYYGYVLSDWTVTGLLVNATRGTGAPVIAPHRADSSASTPADRHVIHIQQGPYRETRFMVEHALHTGSVRAVRFAVFVRAVAGWEGIVGSVTQHLASIGLEEPVTFVWGVEEAFDAAAAVAAWVNVSADSSRLPTAALLFLFAEDVSALMCAASKEARLDWLTTAFYASSLEVPDVALTLTWNRTATLKNSAEARAVFSHLHLMDSLSDYHATTDDVVSYYRSCRAAFVNSSQPAPPELQAYDVYPSRANFAGFVTGYTMMKTFATILNMTAGAFTERLYDAGEVFLNQTVVGPFRDSSALLVTTTSTV